MRAHDSNREAAHSRALELRRVERLKLVDVADGLGLLIPLEITQRNRLECEIHQQKAVLLDRPLQFPAYRDASVVAGLRREIRKPSHRRSYPMAPAGQELQDDVRSPAGRSATFG